MKMGRGMLEDDIMKLLQENGPLSRADIADATGYSPRHLQRILPTIEGIQTIKQGRKILYSVMMVAAAATTSSSSITTPGPDHRHFPAFDVQHGHEHRQMSILDASGDIQHGQVGHSEIESAKARHRIRKETLRSHTPAPNAAPAAPGCADCPPEDAHKCRSCPLSYAELERDTIQFVVVDQEFRDRLVEQATLRHWRRKNSHGQTMIYPYRDLTMAVGKDVVTFYSADPKDLSHIENWIRLNFAGIYSDIHSLTARIRRPAELTRDELTVIVTDPETIREMEYYLHIKAGGSEIYTLKSPNHVWPGFKAYRFGATLRCEFDCRSLVQKINGISIRTRLLEILPGIVEAPGIFAEFLTDYYNPYEHPIIIDTGIGPIIQQFTNLAESMTDKFTAAMHEFMEARPVQTTLPEPEPAAVPAENPLNDLLAEIGKLEGFEIEAICKAVAYTLKLERQAVMVYLAAWSAWAGRNFKGRVLKEDISKLLLNDAKEPTPLSDIADAIEKLQAAGLMQRDAGYDVKFSPAGIMLAKKLTAKREMVQ